MSVSYNWWILTRCWPGGLQNSLRTHGLLCKHSYCQCFKRNMCIVWQKPNSSGKRINCSIKASQKTWRERDFLHNKMTPSGLKQKERERCDWRSPQIVPQGPCIIHPAHHSHWACKWLKASQQKCVQAALSSAVAQLDKWNLSAFLDKHHD